MIEITDECRERLEGATVVASISGGKDSAAMSLALHAAGIEHRRLFLDTGWEHESTYQYLRGPLADALGPIEERGRDGGMVELVRSKGAFPSRTMRYCTQQLKAKPARDYIRELLDAGHTVVNAVGIRRGESTARSKMQRWEYQDFFNCWVWRPIIDWSEQDVIDCHHEHGLPPHPLYLKGATRVGCWPCIFARKAELAAMDRIDPDRVDAIEALEAEVQELARKRYEARGETFESLGYTPPTFFHKHDCGARERNVGIRDVIAWAKTARGGKQLELFAPPKEELGCMRWGLCETGEEDE